MGVAIRPRLAGLLLVLTMAVGSVYMWVGIPATWLWIASHLGGGSNLFSYFFALFLCPISMLAFAALLRRMEDVHDRVAGAGPSEHRHIAWLKPMSGEDTPPRTRGLLDTFMVISAAIAVIAFLVWYFGGFAPSPAPFW